MNSSKKLISVNWKPQKNTPVSLVDQIVSYVKNRVYKGDWISGDSLPSQRYLAKVFQVNRSTIVDAFSELISMGIIESKVGSGTIISNSSWSFLVSTPTPDWSKYITHGLHKSNTPTIQAINKFEFTDSIIRLSTGEVSPELMPQEDFSKVLNKIADLKIPYNYLEPLGLYELRVELCNHLKKYNLNITPSEILIVSGSLQALQLISLSLLGGNSTVFIEKNSYVKSLKVFEFAGINMEPIPSDKEGIMPWAIHNSCYTKGHSLLYTIPSFHNPTGLTMGESRRLELLNWCKKNNLPIIEDNAYGELFFDSPPPHPIKTFDHWGNVLYLGSVSKSLAPGMRIGWIVGPESIIERLGDIKMQTDYGASSISQWMLTYLLRDKLYDNHLIWLRKELKKRCDYMLKLLKINFSDIATWNTPKGGFYIWLKLIHPISMKKLFKRALKRNVLINPGYIYGFKENSFIRLSYSYASLKEMEYGLIILSDIIRDINNN